MGFELKALDKIIRDSSNLNYLYANIGNDSVQIPMVVLFGDQMPIGIVFSEDIPNEEIEIDQFYAVGANGLYDNFIEGTECHAGGRWYKRDYGWEYKEPYWHASTQTTQSNDYIEILTSEALLKTNIINIWNDEGIGKARKASNINKAYEAFGFVKNDVAQDVMTKVYFSGIIPGFSNLIPGRKYFVGVDGSVVDENNLPSAGESIIQNIGKAISTTEIDFKPEEIIILSA